jgi:hypothetical protein
MISFNTGDLLEISINGKILKKYESISNKEAEELKASHLLRGAYDRGDAIEVLVQENNPLLPLARIYTREGNENRGRL